MIRQIQRQASKLFHPPRTIRIVKRTSNLTLFYQNPQNWSSNAKLFVAFQICFLNWVFYMSSSIYVPGELRLMEDFGVGEIVATLGLSLFTV